jgi:hypothetical protein
MLEFDSRQEPLLNEADCVSQLVRYSSRLSGVVVSVLATRPQGRGFKPGREDGFLKGDKN